MPSKDRISVKFDEGIRQFIEKESKKTKQSQSSVVARLVTESIRGKEEARGLLAEQRYCDSTKKTPWRYYRHELGIGTKLASGQITSALEVIYEDCFETEVVCLKQSQKKVLPKKDDIKRHILSFLSKKIENQYASKHTNNDKDSKPAFPNVVFVLLLNAEVYCIGQGVLPSIFKVKVYLKYSQHPIYYNKDNNEFHLDMMKIRYMSFKEVATRTWSNKNYSHFIPVGINKNIWGHSNYGAYFVGVLHKPMSYDKVVSQEWDVTGAKNVAYKFLVHTYPIRIKSRTFPTIEEVIDNPNNPLNAVLNSEKI